MTHQPVALAVLRTEPLVAVSVICSPEPPTTERTLTDFKAF